MGYIIFAGFIGFILGFVLAATIAVSQYERHFWHGYEWGCRISKQGENILN